MAVIRLVISSNLIRGANFIIKIICIREFFFSERKKFKRYTLSGSNPHRAVEKLLGIVKLWIATYNFYLVRGIA